MFVLLRAVITLSEYQIWEIAYLGNKKYSDNILNSFLLDNLKLKLNYSIKIYCQTSKNLLFSTIKLICIYGFESLAPEKFLIL